MPTTRTPAPPRRQVYRRKQRRHRPWLWLLPAAALLALAAAVLLYDAAPAPQAAPAAKHGDAPSEPQDDRIVVAVDPGHGGVNPNIGSEDYGAEGCGLRECDITLQTARLLCAKLEADGRFRPLLTADGSAYLKPSQRAELAQNGGAQLLVSIHLNYDTSAASGFECYAAPPHLATNADSLRFARLVADEFSALGLTPRGGSSGVRYMYFDEYDNRIFTDADDTTVHTGWPTYTVVESSGCPAVLCEEGFISSAGDMEILSGEDGCAAAAEAYYRSIAAYFFPEN